MSPLVLNREQSPDHQLSSSRRGDQTSMQACRGMPGDTLHAWLSGPAHTYSVNQKPLHLRQLDKQSTPVSSMTFSTRSSLSVAITTSALYSRKSFTLPCRCHTEGPLLMMGLLIYPSASAVTSRSLCASIIGLASYTQVVYLQRTHVGTQGSQLTLCPGALASVHCAEPH